MFHTLFYLPLYNALVFLSSVMPGNNIALAVIALTAGVKLILLPFYRQAAVTQLRLRQIEPELRKLKEDHKDDKELQTKKLIELYRQNKINPLISFLVIVVQFPIIFALFYVFRAGFVFKPELLYSFISIPSHLATNFLGLEITAKSWILAALTGLTQFIQMKISLPPLPNRVAGSAPSFKDDLARSMHVNMKYMMPVLIIFIAYNLSSAISLYWITSNLFSIAQEWYIRRTIKK